MGRNIVIRLTERTDRLAAREELAIISAFDSSSGAYTVTYKGASVGPVWSANGALYAVGDQVKVLTQNGIVQFVIP